MTEAELRDLFRRALRASLAVPLLAGVADCSASSAALTGDGGKKDGGPSEVTTKDAGSRDAAHADSGNHDAGQADSAGRDAAQADTGKDARDDSSGNPCAPMVTESTCQVFIPVSCFDGGVADAGHATSGAACDRVCPALASGWGECNVVTSRNDGGMNLLACVSAACSNGRAYAGMARPTAEGQRSPLGRFFAETAQLEAASIDAFRILGGELRAHAAPPELAQAAAVAARDEVRHARVTRRLARRYGPCPPHRRAAARPVRSLEAVAEENAVEGCVRETYAALLAHHQAMAATDTEIREAMTAIAEDETRHAALAWQVAAWAEPRLDREARARIERARALAVRELREAVVQTVPRPLTETAGLPSAEAASRMLAVLEEELWRERASGL